MLSTIINVIFILVSVSMVGLILLQRGAGASAGSGFGGGASATVFGARGSANFLTSATKWLAVVFFALTLYMSWSASRRNVADDVSSDLGVMSDVKEAPVEKDALPALPSTVVPAPAEATTEVSEEAPADEAAETAPALEEPADAATDENSSEEKPAKGSQDG